MPARNPAPPDAALGLALAILAVSASPLVLLDSHLNVVGVSTSFAQSFQIDRVAAVGRPFFELGDGEWGAPQLRALLELTLAGSTEIDAYEMDLRRGDADPRLLVFSARRVDYSAGASTLLLLTIADITEARLSERLTDDLVREKTILLQEVQHRVANSLQIIASVILQNARRVQSEETRSHLHDAHNRVMSIAVLQQQLAASRLGAVELRMYFNGLCKSIGASMIRDHNQISLTASTDDSAVSADVSVSLGLIVTELVINALKHAFPGLRPGKITVGYTAHGADWNLTVSDNGVGMHMHAGSAKPGLGTSIVEALANQLGASVEVVDAHPGTRVSVIYRQVAAAIARAVHAGVPF
jgi:two-component sensor histidine kinase